jgi:hypothetical protein
VIDLCELKHSNSPWQQSTQEDQKARAGVFSCRATQPARDQALGPRHLLVAVSENIPNFDARLQLL